MYLILIFLVPLLFITMIMFFLHHKKINTFSAYQSYDYSSAKLVWSIITFVSIFVIFMVNFVSNTSQIEAYLNIEKTLDKKEIYKERADHLGEIFQRVLVDKYPTYEKEIFGNMKTEDLQMLFIKYPEVKASLTSINYVERMNELESIIYEMDLDILEYVKQCKFRRVSPWLFGSLYVEPSSNIKNLFE